MHRCFRFALGAAPNWPVEITSNCPSSGNLRSGNLWPATHGYRQVSRQPRAVCVALVAICLTATMLSSASLALESHASTTSNEARAEATRAIPIAKIDAEFRQTVRQVVGDATLYRRLPTCVVDCYPGLFTYVAQNPEVMVAMWRELGISHVDLRRTEPNAFEIRDGSGTVGKLWIVEQNCDDNAQNRLVMVAEGSYEGKPFSRPVKAQCVLLLRSGSIKETDGRRYVAARLDTFIRLDRTGVKLFAKAVHPWVGKMADRNFSDTLTFVSKLSHTAEQRPDAIGRLADKLAEIPLDRREHLMQVAYRCADDSAQWRTHREAQRERFAQASRPSPPADGNMVE